MCAADILLAAPNAKIYDYPFLGIQNSGGVMTMLQEILNQRRLDGTPHLISNSYGYYSLPSHVQFPNHELYDINHPVNRKVREVVISGAPAFFAAGNCGQDCRSGNCDTNSIGPGRSIHGSNSLEEVITVAAVNVYNERIGYSSQGPEMFATQKPDISTYSHFYGNFGSGRPDGTTRQYDDGTSAAAAVAAGVAALLMSAVGVMTPARLKTALIESTIHAPVGNFDHDLGFGVINAERAYDSLIR